MKDNEIVIKKKKTVNGRCYTVVAGESVIEEKNHSSDIEYSIFILVLALRNRDSEAVGLFPIFLATAAPLNLLHYAGHES